MAPSRAPGGLVLGRIGGAPVVVNPTSAFLGLIIAGSWFPAVSSALGAYGIVTVMGVIVRMGPAADRCHSVTNWPTLVGVVFAARNTAGRPPSRRVWAA